MSKSLVMKLGAGGLLGVLATSVWFFAVPLPEDPAMDFGYALAQASPSEAAEQFDLLPRETIQEILGQKLVISKGKPVSADSVASLAERLEALSIQHRFDAAFILAVIDVESGFQVRAKSPAGALGLMQLMPATARVISRRYRIGYRGAADLLNPEINLTLGVTYLAELRDKYGLSSPYYQFAAYNIGPARLDELLRRRHFKPTQTLRYFEGIRERMLRYHHFGKDAGEPAPAAKSARRKTLKGMSRV